MKKKVFKLVLCKAYDRSGWSIEEGDKDFDKVTYCLSADTVQTVSDIMCGFYEFYYAYLSTRPEWKDIPWRDKMRIAVRDFVEYSKKHRYYRNLALIEERDITEDMAIESMEIAIGS